MNILRNIILLMFLGFLSLASPALATDDGSTVTITSPQNGDIVSDTFDLTYELSKGTQGDHVHTYVDGKYQKGFKGTFHGLPKGKHHITVKAANHDHDVLTASDTIEVEVQ